MENNAQFARFSVIYVYVTVNLWNQPFHEMAKELRPFREMTNSLSHFMKWLNISGFSWNGWNFNANVTHIGWCNFSQSVYKMFYYHEKYSLFDNMNIKACISLLYSYSIINVINNSFVVPCKLCFTYDDIISQIDCNISLFVKRPIHSVISWNS